MKLRARTFRIQWDLHAWAGVATSLLLFVIFFFGVLALFFDELIVWQDPALHVAPAHARAEPRDSAGFDQVLATLEREGPVERGSRIAFWPREGTRFVTTYVTGGDGDERVRWIDPVTGSSVPERSRLAEELYFMHFFYRVPGGLELTGFLALGFLVALVSGLLVHLKDLRRQWWRFRPSLKLRHSSSDAHKVLGVFGLPFALVLAWSGAVICLGNLTGEGLAAAALQGDVARAHELGGETSVARAAANEEAVMLSPDELVRRAQAAYDTDALPWYVDVQLYGDANAYGRVYFPEAGFETRRYVVIGAVDGAILATASERATPSRSFEEVMWALHFAEYGGLLLKVLYAVLALAVCGVIVTGNLIWLERRDARRAHRGNRLLERLTVGIAGGAVLGSAAQLAANRLLPWDLERRADWEFAVLLATWGATALAALMPRWTAPRVTAGLATGASALFAAVVVMDAATLEANLFTAIGRGLPVVFVSELLLVALALGCGGLAWGVGRRAAAAAWTRGKIGEVAEPTSMPNASAEDSAA